MSDDCVQHETACRLCVLTSVFTFIDILNPGVGREKKTCMYVYIEGEGGRKICSVKSISSTVF